MSTAVNTSEPTSLKLPGWFLPSLIVVGVAAALASEPIVSRYRIFFFTATGLPPFPPALLWQVFWDNVYNHTICYGFLGAVICSLVSLVAGCTVSTGRAIVGFVVGLLLGFVAGAGLGIGGWYLSAKILQQMDLDSIIKAFVIFIPFWFGLAIVTCIVSLALMGRLRYLGKSITSALLCAVVGTLAYVGVVTVAFPSDWPGMIIPENAPTRIVLYLAGCIAVATSIFFTLRDKKPKINESTTVAETES